MSIKELDPQIVWKNFYALTQIPRPSKQEEGGSSCIGILSYTSSMCRETYGRS